MGESAFSLVTRNHTRHIYKWNYYKLKAFWESGVEFSDNALQYIICRSFACMMACRKQNNLIALAH